MKRINISVLIFALMTSLIFLCQTSAADEIPFIEFVNEPSGQLTVSKTVEGVGADTNKLWTFTVSLGDKTFNGGPYNTPNGNQVSFTNGSITFQLKHNQSITFDGLPVGVEYTVTETEANADGYKTSSKGDTGTVLAGSASVAAFTNTRAAGNLSVTKTVTGSGGDTDRYFNFTVTLSDTSISGLYGDDDSTDMTFNNGIANFTLKHGETRIAKNLPTDITYTVTETDANKDGYTTTSENTSGTIKGGETSSATFTNNRPGGNLSVTKKVTGTGGDKSKNFNFTVTLSDNTIDGEYGDMDFTDGVANFTLKHGETKTAKNLPSGTTYTVKETDANEDGYTTTSENIEGKIPDEDTVTATFTNNKMLPVNLPDTGGTGVLGVITCSVLACILGITLTLTTRKHKKIQ